MQPFHLAQVLGSDIPVTKYHQIVYVVSRLEEQAPHSGVRNFFSNKGYRSQMQFHKFLHIFHLLILRKFE